MVCIREHRLEYVDYIETILENLHEIEHLIQQSMHGSKRSEPLNQNIQRILSMITSHIDQYGEFFPIQFHLKKNINEPDIIDVLFKWEEKYDSGEAYHSMSSSQLKLIFEHDSYFDQLVSIKINQDNVIALVTKETEPAPTKSFFQHYNFFKGVAVDLSAIKDYFMPQNNLQ
jgi:hypothetical protein